jgi:predicted kinase
MKELFLLRGLPGSGKSTLAKSLGGKHFEADMYFVRDGEYNFDVTKLKEAHEWCRSSVGGLMINEEPKLVVSNTFTQEWEMKPYFDLARNYGYRVHSLIVENRHGGVNEHGVPEEKLEQMKNRFEIKLS